ncbi:MAG: FtsX-like permease family protein [Prevotella sp.]|nr:FtsX-like permease family protein [Prevotella sp.]
MNQTIKNFWAHRRQNGFVFIEIALIAVLSFYMLDYITIWTYGKYFCHADGEFEKEHLLVGQTGRITPLTTESATAEAEAYADTARLKPFEREALQVMASLYAFRDEVRALPEVQSVCLTREFVGDGYSRWKNYHPEAPEADTTKTCSAYTEFFTLNQCYFETLGMTAVEGSPTLETLSAECPQDGVIITRSLAVQLFGTAEAVGRRMVETRYVPGPDGRDVETTSHHTVFGVVEDVKPYAHERYHYIAFFPTVSFGGNTPRMLIRLKPEADAGEFIAKYKGKANNGTYALAWLHTYNDYQAKNVHISDQYIIITLLSTLGLLFALNVVLGTLGTFWLQIRKRTEDIGIMRSFGAKRRHIFWMVWGEGALLTLLACIVGQLIWLQFAVNIGLADGNIRATSLRETDWVNTFWLHFLIVCAVQYLLLLAIVTLGMVVPTFIAMYKRPVEALHHE